MVCKNCGYMNRDGVEFCRHCGISLKEKSRRTIKVRASAPKPRPSAKEANIFAEDEDFSFTPRNKKPHKARYGEEERIQRGGANYKAATVAIGIFVIVCVIAFGIFVFDIPIFPGDGGKIKIESITVPTDIPSQETAPEFTPVPTVASSPA